jgi:hypothetical protein
MDIGLRVKVPLGPYWREPNVNSSCTSDNGISICDTLSESVRRCGMEATSEPQHRTRVNSGAGRPVWESVPRNVTPDIQSRQDGSRSGGGGKSYVFTLGDLLGSANSGRTVGDGGPMPGEKSDHLIVVLKPGNAGGVKGVTG